MTAATLFLVGSFVGPAAGNGPPQVATGTRWAIATGHPDSTAAGLAVLRDGGNVIDAAVAASLTLGVAEPYGSGLGGKLVMLYRDGATGEVTCIEALCASPLATDPDAFAALPRRQRRYGYHSVCVPGLPAGLHEAHQRWGSKPWRELVMPASRLAKRGITVSPAMRELWKPHRDDLAADPEAARLYLKEGETPPVKARLTNAELADTLARYADGGADGFYQGATAERIVAAAEAAGAPLSLEDFTAYRATVTKPLAANYRGYRVYSSPPPLTGGVTVLAALMAQDIGGEAPPATRDAEYIDRFGRILRVLYPAVSAKVADTPEAFEFAERWLTRDTATAVADKANAITATTADVGLPPVGTPTLDDASTAGTTHLVVADADGNMVSLTQSLSLHFGAAVVPPGTGLLLNDSMSNFATTWRASPNYIAPGKRPRSTVSPVLATRDGLPTLTLGLPGGQRIPTMTLQLLADHLGAGVPLSESFARPRFHLRRPLSKTQPGNAIDLEGNTGDVQRAGLARALQELGWQTHNKPANGLYFGGGNAIVFQPGGKLSAIADSRRTNSAAAD